MPEVHRLYPTKLWEGRVSNSALAEGPEAPGDQRTLSSLHQILVRKFQGHSFANDDYLMLMNKYAETTE